MRRRSQSSTHAWLVCQFVNCRSLFLNQNHVHPSRIGTHLPDEPFLIGYKICDANVVILWNSANRWMIRLVIGMGTTLLASVRAFRPLCTGAPRVPPMPDWFVNLWNAGACFWIKIMAIHQGRYSLTGWTINLVKNVSLLQAEDSIQR